MAFEPIAVVGQACVLPGALSPDALWQKVRAGRDLVGAAPAGRWRLSRARALGDGLDRARTDRGGYVAGFEETFDPSGFAVPATEVRGLDPLFRWLLHVSREALRDARLEGGARVGAVFGNLSFPSASLAAFAERVWLGDALADLGGIGRIDPRNRFTSGLPAHLVARALGLGEAFCLDAACASSLYAIKLACDRLHAGSADAMLAGAVSCCDDLFIHIGFSALQALSPSGQSRPFHREADGLLPAEGAGAVVLKRLADAEAAGDRILGVLRGLGLSNDGRGSGLLAPSEDGQVRAMRAAYEQAGLSPREISLVECHATGTAVGDAAELRSMRRVFEDAKDLPIGSLKSNFGHAITVAGVAGLLKILGAFAARERPPTLHADAPLDELSKSPFRLLREAEPWPSEGPRRAALSAFGFGGCNAHLIAEEHLARPKRTKPRAPPTKGERAEIAVVGLGALVGSGTCTADLERVLFEAAPVSPRATALALGAGETRFPPRDLAQALPQQVWLLAAASEALAGLKAPPRDRLGVFVGMGCDPEIARHGARWRTRELAESWGIDEEAWARQVEDAFLGPLEAAGVLGTLPNLPANRLNFQLDAAGQGFTVSAEELSGIRSMEIAVGALRRGELDLALVGASDFTGAVHEAATGHPGADAAVVFAVERAEDARKQGHRVLALVDLEDDGEALSFEELEARAGRAHAAHGLVQLAAATLCCARARRPDGKPWPGDRRARLHVEGLGGQSAFLTVRSPTAEALPSFPVRTAPAGAPEYRAHRPLPALPPLPEAAAGWNGLQAPNPTGPQRMMPAPALPRVLDEEEPVAHAGTPTVAQPRAAAAASTPPIAAWIAEQQILLAKAHRQFVEGQSQAQQQFLALRERTARALIDPGAVRRVPKLPFQAPASSVIAPPAPKAPAQPASAPAAEAPKPGPKLDREGLAIHASGKISEIYGPLFAKQDGFRRQVRMPEPPLLLADRLLGIDAEPGTMGVGKLWTETDVTPDAWYLHDGRMPAGILIESGQADLMLISYLGVDFLNRSERVYRLLGCDLTYHGSLPAPGETLRYEISVDGHANQGEVRLFFFHYDCKAGAQKRLTVRNGQAGFFTDAELDDSMGVLWDAATGEHAPEARVDAPRAACARTRFERSHLEAFAAGRVADCFGPGFEFAATHTRSPRISGGRMLFLEQVDEVSPRGGPWGRGYLRATDRLQPDDWFFQGHFKNDPCMPGTLMFEGCLQAMAFYLASMGYTLDKDGWRFEPVPDETYRLRCRGQATPQSKELTYEVFVEELHDGPEPTLWADLLVTVDGRKAFHCRRMGLRLVPGWPLDSLPEARTLTDSKPVAMAKGFAFGARSVLACAWGRPSEAFGEMYRPFDGPRIVPRLPGPPYLFMSRVTRVEGEIGAMQLGSAVEVEYDVPPDAWYFSANGARTMPYAVLLEAALQPCGWLASYVGSAVGVPNDLFFRNLDGNGTLLAEIPPDAGTLVTRSRLTQISRSAGMIIESFDVTCAMRPAGSSVEREVYKLKTVFGFFPHEALEAQKGLPVSDEERVALEAPCEESVDLRPRPERWFAGRARLPTEQLCMLHRLTGIWPDGGSKGLGRFRSELDVEPSAWFFRAHFFQDPVQPGSLGLEAMLQVLQFAMIRKGLASADQRFEPIALGAPLAWKYRGQVRPRNKRVNVLLDVVRVEEDGRGKVAVADASLWVDGLRIYEAKGMAMRAVPAGEPDRDSDEEILAPETHPWLPDHRPTWTVPALPLMSMVSRLADRAAREAGAAVVAVEDARVHRWLPIAGPTRLSTTVEHKGDGRFQATLSAWREASRAELSRFEPVATATVVTAARLAPCEVAPWSPPADARPVPDPYATGALFHGPAFQLLRSLAIGSSGSSALLDAGPRERLLDALTHAIPHDALQQWSAKIGSDLVAYPQRVRSLHFYGPLPTEGTLRCEARFAGFEGDERHPRFEIQAIADGRVLAALDLVEVLFPKGPLGCAPPDARRAFLRDRRFVAGVRLSTEEGGVTHLAEATVAESDWLPGTLAGAYGCEGPDRVAEIAAKDHVAARAHVHPSAVVLEGDLARTAAEPLNLWPLRTVRSPGRVEVRDAAPAKLDLGPVRAHWDRHFGVGRWPVEDLYYGLAERFLRRVHFEDPETRSSLRGRAAIYLGNHQVAIESLLFSVVVSGLTGTPTVTLAKAEHRASWLGRLIVHAFGYPGVTDPGVITFFDRGAQDELPKVVAALSESVRRGEKAVMVHVEGTRALSCRAPVAKMSGAFLDMALATGTPIVPIRFVGGLPAEPLAERLEFPFGMGRQDLVVGRPIAPETLARLDYKQRKDLVVAAINDLAPPDEAPFESDPAFASAVQEWARKTGATPEHAALMQTLVARQAPCELTRRLVDGANAGCALEVGAGPVEAWLAELARRLYGPAAKILERR